MVINGGSLAPLEFADCLTDSPEFRENLNRHEKELDKTSQQIKRIIKEIKELLQAAKSKLVSMSPSMYQKKILLPRI
jgi:BAR domain of APPL family